MLTTFTQQLHFLNMSGIIVGHIICAQRHIHAGLPHGLLAQRSFLHGEEGAATMVKDGWRAAQNPPWAW